MKIKDFRIAIKRGLIEAIVELQNNQGDTDKYCNHVLHACLNYTRHDYQCEQSRHEYLYQAILLTNKREFLQQEIIKKFNHTKNINLINHLSSILYCLARDNSQEAREALHNKFQSYILSLDKRKKHKSMIFSEEKRAAECIGIWIIELDGMASFLYIANILGRLMIEKQSRDIFFIDKLYDSAKNKFGEKNIIAVLKDYRDCTGKFYSIKEFYTASVEYEDRKLCNKYNL